jgi:1-aminocyclopropane-1-carboxylate deaminase/D-cysteine desulfhydrase-like pyridoxal-dependent ACC family enzyme
MPIITPIPLILRPTPLHRLDRASRELGVDLWIKRDDLTGFALGGNKGRKLEFLLADALEKRAQVVVTCGSGQSNFIRQLGAACVVNGIRCAAAVMGMPFEYEKPTEPGLKESNGNVELGQILGIDFRWQPDGTWEELYAASDRLVDEYRSQGFSVYQIPIGGSSPLGAYGFLEAAKEIPAGFDVVAFASSSGSTHVGLQMGLFGTRIYGFACDPEPEIAADFAELGNGLRDLVGSADRVSAEDFELDFDFVGQGYGIPSEAGNAAIEWLARTEGIFLDPIYSGKAFAGLKARIEQGSIRGKILFWHTGGIPALFAVA